MGLGSVFKKLGGGTVKVLKGGWKVINKVDDVVDAIPGASSMVAMIPIVGPGLKAGLDMVDDADDLIAPGEEQGDTKRGKAAARLRAKLLNMGYSDEKVNEIVAIAYLVRRGVAEIAVDEKDLKAGPDKTQEPPKPKAAKKKSSKKKTTKKT